MGLLIKGYYSELELFQFWTFTLAIYIWLEVNTTVVNLTVGKGDIWFYS